MNQNPHPVAAARLAGSPEEHICATCAHLTPFELAPELNTCPVVNIRIHSESATVFGCNQWERRSPDADGPRATDGDAADQLPTIEQVSGLIDNLRGGLTLREYIDRVHNAEAGDRRAARLQTLVDKWREFAAWEHENSNPHYASALDQCADELALTLEGQPE